jgi:hypothetical protein
VKQARKATPVSKARRGRLAHPVLSFAVVLVRKALRVKPAREAQRAGQVLAVKARSVMSARQVNEDPPGPKGRSEIPEHVAPL